MVSSIRWLLAIVMLLPPGVGAAASEVKSRTDDYVWLLFLNVNEPPQVNAGVDQTITTNKGYLNATVIDDPRDTLAYVWTKVSGPGSVAFTNPSAEDTAVTFSASGIYTLQLSVSDGKLTSTDRVTITVNNSAPQVDAGEDEQIIHPTNSVYLNANVIDDPHDKLTYTWSIVSGPGTTVFANSSAEDTNVTFYTIGTYILQLKVSDWELSSTDTVTVQYLPERGDVIVAVGDSITVGVGDGGCTDKSCAGYTPKLKGLLESARGYSHTIWEEGEKGETSSGGRSRIGGITDSHPNADQYLIMYGTNDANKVPVIPSGYGLNPGDSGYPGSYKDNMQRIINTIKSAGAKPALAMVPYAKYPRDFINPKIRRYNLVVDELRAKNSIQVSAPDFYTWFEGHQSQLNLDGLHPTTTGYWSMAQKWRDKLTQ